MTHHEGTEETAALPESFSVNVLTERRPRVTRWLSQDRSLMSFSHIVHSVAALVIFTVSLGHICVGTIGMEGALKGMTTGYSDANWAKEHHDLWYADYVDRAQPYPDEAANAAPVDAKEAVPNA